MKKQKKTKIERERENAETKYKIISLRRNYTIF